MLVGAGPIRRGVAEQLMEELSHINPSAVLGLVLLLCHSAAWQVSCSPAQRKPARPTACLGPWMGWR